MTTSYILLVLYGQTMLYVKKLFVQAIIFALSLSLSLYIYIYIYKLDHKTGEYTLQKLDSKTDLDAS